MEVRKMKFCYLRTERLRLSEENVFEPITGKEYEELKESIRESDIMEPLIVTEAENSIYKIYDGQNRFLIAKELSIQEVPCLITEKDALAAIYDVNLFRRFLTAEQKESYKRLKEEAKKRILEKTISSRLVPELADRFRQGLIPQGVAMSIAKCNREEQTTFFDAFQSAHTAYVDDDEVNRLEKELESSKEEALRLKETLSDRESTVKELREREDKAKELLKEKLSQLDKNKENAGKEVRKEYEKEIKELQKNLQDLSKVVKQKNEEMEAVKEEKEKAERMQDHRQAEVNAVLMKMREYRDTCRDFLKKYSNPKMVISRFDNVMAELNTLNKHVIQFQWDKETADLTDKKAKEIIDKVKEVAKNLRENVADEVINPSDIGK